MSDAIVPKGQPIPGDPEKKGWLFKWTNYLKGYQRRWFVLSNGSLSYYRNQAEMVHTCRGMISLLGALIHTADSCTFVISNGGTQTFHIRAHDEVERQSWVTALELAKAKAIRAQESDDDEDQMSSGAAVAGGPEGEGEDAGGIARELGARFHDLRTCSELVARHGAALQRSLVDLEIPPTDNTKQVSERATLFRISCNAMMNACSEFMNAAAASSARMNRALQHEREQKMRLQEIVEQLARQHDNLEKTVTGRSTANSGGTGSGQGNDTEDEDHEFFDAMEEGVSTTRDDKTSFVMKVPVNRKNKVKAGESSDESEGETVTETQQVLFLEDKERAEAAMGGPEATASKAGAVEQKIWPHVSQVTNSTVDGHPRRTRVPDKPNYPLSLWSIMKNCIGKELSKIPIPVNFSEPLSMLQRLVEDYEYSSILDRAAQFSDPAQQLAYVAAFTVSSYATTSCRTNKPFNPLLGETYECDRMADLGWRAISEQVSHHPPMVAQFCEGQAGWQCWQEFTMTTKFRGKYLQVVPLGSASAMFRSSGNKYMWRKVTTTVHNIIVGKLWVDNHGDMDIVGEAGPAKGYVAHLKYQPYSYFSKDTQRKVTGIIKDPDGVPRYVLQGYWDSKVEVAPVTSASPDNTVCKTGKFCVAWERVPAPPDSDKWYYFTLLAAQLNELENGVAPTDSRLRPDQRLMEEGLWNEANAEKLRLEEKQRAKRRQMEAEAEAAAASGAPPAPAPAPAWFSREAEPGQPHLRHLYNHRYWESKERQDWSACPDIY
ncbi:oxysterol-binding protein 1 isoform X2 [Amyelois transitella]|uniref:oxysterol-binding protein 1 isoform X2 n=1 Tax=Amyelois transitella TaxID=680683 RepID=UPI0029907AC6|nr:oxysterol-binding protein 1 isoform X2 [Amyelois transitella]